MKNKFLVTALFLLFGFFGFSQDWHTNMDEAKKLAANKNEKILLVFQGSDWCAPCMKLDRQIFKTDEFQSLVKNKFVMVKADFPRKKNNKLAPELEVQNAKLAATYNGQGFFPLVVVIDQNGKVLGKMGYENISPKEYFTKIAAIK